MDSPDASESHHEGGHRIREERKRLGCTQKEFAVLGGVARLSQFKYEKGEHSPGLQYLNAISRAGADVLYIVTGERMGAVLSPQALRRLEMQAMIIVDDYVSRLPEQRVEAHERFTLFDAFRDQLKRDAGTK